MKSINPLPIFQRPATLFAIWVLLLLVVALVYWPGLSGPFLFDDYGTLAALGNLGGVNNWETFKAYVLGGFTGPTGRPLALLSFLIDGNNWPTDAWPFKRTNLVIHIFNGVLLGAITQVILQRVGKDKSTSMWLALICAAIWMLHPFLVSTTLYVVQRMAQLSTMFIFVGMGLYLYSRSLLDQQPAKAYAAMSLSIGLCTLLAMISKENGILLPLLILVLEATIFSSEKNQSPTLNRYWYGVFLLAPSLVVFAYLGYYVAGGNFFEIAPSRNFSTYERLLTESRVLVDYMSHWFLPKLYTAGVFQDHFSKSTGLMSPVSTALSMLFHVSLISLCVIKRRVWPLLAFAILFFYASHVIESTVINLELYFEHRNYLAAAFLFVPIIAWLHGKAGRPLFAVIVLALLLGLAGFTRFTSTVWASYETIVETAAEKVPDSPRAQHQYALALYNSMQYDESLRLIDTAIERMPKYSQLYVLRATILCNLGILSNDEFSTIRQAISGNEFDARAFKMYSAMVGSIAENKCPAVELQNLRTLFTDTLAVPKNSDAHSLVYSYITYLIGIIDIKLNDPESAMHYFSASLGARPGASQTMQMASLLATHEYYEEAMHLSDIALREFDGKEAGLLSVSNVSKSDILGFRETIRLEMNDKASTVEALPGSQD